MPLPAGAQQRQDMIDGGAPPAQVDQWVMQQRQTMVAGGAPVNDVDDYWGLTKPAPDMSAVTDHIQQNVTRAALDPTQASDPWSALVAGFEGSATGTAFRGGAPADTVLPQNANLFNKIIGGFSGVVSDIPEMAAGFLGGAAVGAAAGGPVGATVGGFAGANAVPAAIRGFLVDHYQKGDFKSWGDFLSRAAPIAIDTAKSAGAGVAMGVAATGAGAIAEAAGGGLLAAIGARTLAGATAATAYGAAFGGGFDLNDFITNAAIMVGGEAAGHFTTGGRLEASDALKEATTRLENVYAATGIKPADAVKGAKADPAVASAVATFGDEVDPAGKPVVPPALDALKTQLGVTEAYHGTAADFQEFDSSKIGTGEGAQSYGYGHYLTDTPAVAEKYASDDRRVQVTVNGEPIVNDHIGRIVSGVLAEARGDAAKAIEVLKSEMEGSSGSVQGVEDYKYAIGRIEEYQKGTIQVNGSNVYKVQIKADTDKEFLQFDKPISQQPPVVRAALVKLGYDEKTSPDVTAGTWIKQLEIDFGNAKAVSDRLAASGVKGVKYLDQNSRATGEGTHNYVVFNDKDLEVTDKNGVPVKAPLLPEAQKAEDDAVAGRELAVSGDNTPGVPPGEPPNKPPLDGEIQEPGAQPKKIEDMNALERAQRNLLALKAQPRKSSWWPDYLNPKKLLGTFDSILAGARAVDRAFEFNKDDNMGVEDLLRWTFGSAGRAAQFLRKGVIDSNTRTIVSDASYVKALQAVKEDGGNMADLEDYRIAKRMIELHGRGIDAGLSLADAKAIAGQVGWAAKYDRALSIISESKDGLINYGRDSGLWSAGQAKAMKDLNRFHVVFKRLMDPSFDPRTYGTGKSAFRTGKAVKKIEGSAKEILSTAQSDVINYQTIVAMADRNTAFGRIVGMIEDYNRTRGDGLPVPLERVRQEILGTDASGKPLFGDLTDEDGNLIPDALRKALEPLLLERKLGPGLGPDDFLYYRDGKAEIWHSTDPELSKALRTTWPEPGGPVPQLLIAFAKIQRSGITGMLDFPFRALMHGQLAAAAFSPGKFMLPYHDVIKGALKYLSEEGHASYERWITEGGADAAMVDIVGKYLTKDMEKDFDGTRTSSMVWNAFTHPIEAMRAASRSVENMARYGRYLGNVEAGASPEKAAMISRVSHLDYKEQFGTQWLQTWSRMVPFMQTGFKDVGQVTQALREHPLGAAVSAATVLTMPTIMNWAANYLADQNLPDKDKYSNIPQWERDMYWVLPPINGVRLKVKKPYVGGYMFSTLPERFLNEISGREPSTAASLASAAYAQMMPSVIPTFAQPIAEQALNRNLYTGQPLISAQLERLSPQLQYKPDTTEVAKKVGAALNISPITFQNYMNDWAGPLPMTIQRILETPFHPVSRPQETADIPFLGSFFVRNSQSGQILDNFYSKTAEVSTAHADLAAAIKSGDVSQIRQYQTQQAAVRIGGTQRAIAKYTADIRSINENKTMTPEEKQKYTDIIATQMTAIAKNATEYLNRLK